MATKEAEVPARRVDGMTTADSDDQIVEEIPTTEDLYSLEAALSQATEPIELLHYQLSRIVRNGINLAREMTPADAWEYTLFARSLRIDADLLTKYANSIEEDVEYIMTEGQR